MSCLHLLPSISIVSCAKKKNQQWQQNSSKKFLIHQPPLPFQSLSSLIQSNFIQWKHSSEPHLHLLPSPAIHSQVSDYMMSQLTGIARYPPSLETLSDLNSKSSSSLDCLVGFFSLLAFLVSTAVCLLCWTSNIGKDQLSSDHLVLLWHSFFQ